MNILLLEDSGAVLYYVAQWCDRNGHTLLNAYNPSDAQSHWARRQEVPIHCILLDLQTPTDGLTDEQETDADGGTLAGWIWLRDNVLAEMPEMRQRTIIYSAYVDVLRDKIPEGQYSGIKVIPKRRPGGSADVVIASIREIARMSQMQQRPSKRGDEYENLH